MDKVSTRRGSDTPLIEIFLVFLQLGCTSFGGPVAHIGFFRKTFVERLCWLQDSRFAEYLALCQFIPGPASSQLGMAIGFDRRRYSGAIAAWLGFTLPSAILLGVFAALLTSNLTWLDTGMVKGLKLVALSVVVHAFLDMRSSLAPDIKRLLILILSTCVFLVWESALAPLLVLLVVGFVCAVAVKLPQIGGEGPGTPKLTHSAVQMSFLALFFLLLAGPLLVRFDSILLDQLAAYYRSGALVFGGGHVVLPLLESEVVIAGWVEREAFLAGYGAAQAVPGPLFTFASFLGASHRTGVVGVVGWALATLAIFLPSFLLLFGVLPFWQRLRNIAKVRAALYGVNASVLGLLAATIFDPLIVSSVANWWDLIFAITAFMALRYGEAPIVAIVIAGALSGVVLF